MGLCVRLEWCVRGGTLTPTRSARPKLPSTKLSSSSPSDNSAACGDINALLDKKRVRFTAFVVAQGKSPILALCVTFLWPRRLLDIVPYDKLHYKAYNNHDCRRGMQLEIPTSLLTFFQPKSSVLSTCKLSKRVRGTFWMNHLSRPTKILLAAILSRFLRLAPNDHWNWLRKERTSLMWHRWVWFVGIWDFFANHCDLILANPPCVERKRIFAKSFWEFSARKTIDNLTLSSLRIPGFKLWHHLWNESLQDHACNNNLVNIARSCSSPHM